MQRVAKSYNIYVYIVSSIQYPVSSILYPVSSILYPVSCIQYPVSSILYPVYCILYPVSGTLSNSSKACLNSILIRSDIDILESIFSHST